jgi:hypothetical protein
MLSLEEDTMAVTNGNSNLLEGGLEQRNSHENFHSMHDIHKNAENLFWDIKENNACLQTGNIVILV